QDMIRARPRHTLFPYTTLFRSLQAGVRLRLEITVRRGGGEFLAQQPAQVGEHPGHARVVELRGDGRVDRYLLVLELEGDTVALRSEEHTSELQSRENLVCRLLL